MKKKLSAKDRTGKIPFLDMGEPFEAAPLAKAKSNGETYALVGHPFTKEKGHLVMVSVWEKEGEKGRIKTLCDQYRSQDVAGAWSLLPLSRDVCQTCRSKGCLGAITKYKGHQ